MKNKSLDVSRKREIIRMYYCDSDRIILPDLCFPNEARD